ncbi:MAG: hypothetical protein QF473_38815 [Planctomycetota bacterium]|jgi:hypothetical protein|nr:hypothetical protein [Planctomycetota bacterium]
MSKKSRFLFAGPEGLGLCLFHALSAGPSIEFNRDIRPFSLPRAGFPARKAGLRLDRETS